MVGVVVNNGEKVALDYLTGKVTTVRNLILRLFKNDVTPDDSFTAASFTEADFTGYAGITLSGASWTNTAGDPATGVYAEQTFTSTANQSAQPIYGYYITRATDGDLIACERFSNGPYNVANNGDTIKLAPSISVT
jgi:hypothetical protein